MDVSALVRHTMRGPHIGLAVIHGMNLKGTNCREGTDREEIEKEAIDRDWVDGQAMDREVTGREEIDSEGIYREGIDTEEELTRIETKRGLREPSSRIQREKKQMVVVQSIPPGLRYLLYKTVVISYRILRDSAIHILSKYTSDVLLQGQRLSDFIRCLPQYSS